MVRIILILVLGFFLCSNHGFGQLNCIAPDNIIAKYQDDADRLALRKIYRLNSPYVDSVEIPQIVSDTFLNALIAVYNATHIPERDTVVSILDIHTWYIPPMRQVGVAADSSLFWMQQLSEGIIPTGYQALDSIIVKYDLSIDSYEEWAHWFFWHSVVFKSEQNYNIPALANAFETLPDVYFAESKGIIGDGSDITDNLVIGENSGVDLFYSFKWGDCFSGCIAHRTWWFKAHPDCTVEFIKVFGESLPLTSIGDPAYNPYYIYPNPFVDEIWIEGISDVFEYSVSDLSGQIILSGTSYEKDIPDLENLIPGFYVLAIREKNRISTYKVIKS